MKFTIVESESITKDKMLYGKIYVMRSNKYNFIGFLIRKNPQDFNLVYVSPRDGEAFICDLSVASFDSIVEIKTMIVEV